MASGVAVAADYDTGLEAFNSGDFETALAEWIPLAEQGNDKAQCKLGYMHDNGQGLLENHMVSLEWVTKSAIQGNGWCQNYLGLMYEQGRGVSRNITKAYMWFNLADYNGSIHASGNKIRLTKGKSIFKMPFEAMTISDISHGFIDLIWDEFFSSSYPVNSYEQTLTSWLHRETKYPRKQRRTAKHLHQNSVQILGHHWVQFNKVDFRVLI